MTISTHPTLHQFENSSYLSGESAGYVEALYEAYLQDPNSLPDEWKNYFSSLPKKNDTEISHEAIRDFLKTNTVSALPAPNSQLPLSPQKQSAVDALITAYRRYGHLDAIINPLNPPIIPDVRLQLKHHGLSDADLHSQFDARKLFKNNGTATLEKILSTLQQFYCGSIGIEYTRLIN